MPLSIVPSSLSLPAVLSAKIFSPTSARPIFIALTCTGTLAVSGCATQGIKRPYEKVTYVNGVPSYYVVKKADTLNLIASRYRLDYRKVAALNGLDSNYTVYVGQKLRLSGITPVRHYTPSAKASPYRTPPTQASHHTPPYRPVPVMATQKAWLNPVSGSILKTFNPATGMKGTWYKANVGTSVVASQSGTVLYAGDKLSEYGNLIMIRHDSDFVSVYAHLGKIGVQEGQTVQAGQTLGTVGLVGEQPVMEFQIRYRGTPVNPVSFLK